MIGWKRSLRKTVKQITAFTVGISVALSQCVVGFADTPSVNVEKSTELDKGFGVNTIVEGDFEYVVNDDGQTATITKYLGKDKDVVMPNNIGGKEVTEVEGFFVFMGSNVESIVFPDNVKTLGPGLFIECNSLKKIKLPKKLKTIYHGAFSSLKSLTDIEFSEGLEKIGDGAFAGCESLSEINLPDSLKYIGNGIFSECNGLNSINIPGNVDTIESGMLSGCDNLSSITVDKNNTYYDSRSDCNALIDTKNNILMRGCKNTIIPDGVEILADGAFENCKDLENITIPESVRKIGNAFSNCSKLKKIIIPKNVKEIGKSAFSGCTGFDSIVVDLENTVYDSRNNCNAIIEKAGVSLVKGCKNTVMPDDIKEVGNYAFDGCIELTNVNIPEGVVRIGDYAFSGCSGIKSIKFSEKLQTLGKYSLYGCTGLKELIIPDNVTYMGERAISQCTGLTELQLPEGITDLSMELFEACTGLKKVVLPKSLKIIGVRAFRNCSNLEDVNIPENVTDIQSWAFGGCNLKSIYIPAGVKYIGSFAFDAYDNLSSIVVDDNNKVYDSRNNCNAIILTEKNGMLCGCKETVIPDGVVDIYDNCFAGCEGLKSIDIPEGVKNIASAAFSDCKNLESVKLPDSLEMIDSHAFSGCISLKGIELPNGLKSIGYGAFLGCTGINDITIPESVDSIDAEAIGYVWNDETGKSERYDNIKIRCWANAGVEDYAKNNNIEYELLDNPIYAKYKTSVNSDLKTVTLTKYIFDGEENVVLPEEIRGKKVTGISEKAFQNCNELIGITIPKTVTDMLGNPFLNCSNLKSIVVDEENTVYDSTKGCNAIINKNTGALQSGCMNTVIPEGVKTIEREAFANCKNLTQINIPEGVTKIDMYAFKDCTGLKSIELPKSVTEIGDWAIGYVSQKTQSGTSDVVDKNFVIKCWMGSYSEEYAKKKGIKFEYLMTPQESKFKLEYKINQKYKIIGYDGADDTSIVIPDTINGMYIDEIDKDAFKDCKQLESVTISKNITDIYGNPFKYCSNLKEIKVDPENSVYESGDNCNAIIKKSDKELISGCENTVIPNDISEICDSAFEGINGLKEFTIPDSVKYIGEKAFLNCNLKQIYIPKNVEQIGDYAFGYNTDSDDKFIPDSKFVLYADYYSGASRYNGLKELEYYIYGKYVKDNSKLLLTDTSRKRDENVIIPDNILGSEVIGIYANTFSYSGMKSVTIPDSVISIGKNAFEGCKNLTSVKCPDTLLYIQDEAFMGCDSLKKINIPASVVSIGNKALGYKDEEEKYDEFRIICDENSKAYDYAIGNNIKTRTEDETEPTTEKPTVRPTEPATEKPTVRPTEPATEKPTVSPTEPTSEPQNKTFSIKNISVSVPGGIACVKDKVKITAKTTGGKGKVEYKFIVKKNKAVTIQDYSAKKTASWTASAAGKHEITVIAKDSSGKTVKKTVKYTVYKKMVINSLKTDIKSGKAVAGSKIKLSVKASGGTGKYEYKFAYACRGSKKLHNISGYGSKKVVSWKPSKSGKYMVYVYVRDKKSKKTVKKTLSYKVR